MPGPADPPGAPARGARAGDGVAPARPISGASVQVAANEIEVRWRPSRHARRLLTLAAAGLLLAVVTRRPELAGLAGPPLLLLGAGRATRGALPGRLGVRVGLTATRIYEGEPAVVDVAVHDVNESSAGGGAGAAEPQGGAAQVRRPLGARARPRHRAGQRDRRQRPGRPVHLRHRPLGQAKARRRHPHPP